MNREIVLQDVVVPICSYEQREGRAHLTRFYGTAFFINEQGYFLTARHVIDACRAESSRLFGLVVKNPHDASQSQIVPLGSTEDAPAPWDIAIGCTHMASRCWFRWNDGAEATEWQNVATLGYPQSALRTTVERFDIHLRTMKGYVLRRLSGDEYGPSGGQAPALELNFAIPAGLSGSPLFLPGNSEKFALVGVCVSSHESETQEFLHEEIEEGGSIFRERRLRVEQFGIAHQLTPLADWKPAMLQGQSIKAAMSN
ncbi:hypothetical protein GCM10019060_21310 [Novosphingobium pokkalii]|nr:hypothetical protein GCM10019060_21310 [Novosphingobium pokkalii]